MGYGYLKGIREYTYNIVFFLSQLTDCETQLIQCVLLRPISPFATQCVPHQRTHSIVVGGRIFDIAGGPSKM